MNTNKLSRAMLPGLVVTMLGLAICATGCGGDSNGSSAPPPPAPPVQKGSCAPSSSIAVLVQGKTVTSYVPKGNWDSDATGVSVVQIEPAGAAAPAAVPTVITTPQVVNSCGSDSENGQTVCSSNNTDVYVISGTSITKTLTSAGTTDAQFSGGSCLTCGVAIDPVHHKALLTVGTSSGPGFQFLDLGSSPTLETAFAAQAGEVSEDPVVDPTRKLILSPTEGLGDDGDYELIKTSSASPAFFENPLTGATFDSAAEDCQTGIALASDEFTGNVFLADLTQAKFTSGSPSGTWSAPSQLQTVPEFEPFENGTDGIAVAQNTHIGVVTGEFGGSLFGAFTLPSKSGSGTPALTDWVACSMPNDPSGATWEQGDDPHTVTAYQSPNSKDAIALLGNGEGSPPTFIGIVDLTKMLNTSIVPRTAGTHNCAAGTNLQTAGVVTFVAVP